jgi:phytanoyl-CoA hydroxylase
MNSQARPAPPSNDEIARGLNAHQAGRSCAAEENYHDLSLLPPEQGAAWMNDGFFIIRALVAPPICRQMSAEVVELFTKTEQSGASFGGHHLGMDGTLAVEEAARVGSGLNPELRMSKLFNIHRKEPFLAFATNPAITKIMHAILGPDVSCFNSQYIFKNPGVWGQPWHQDSLYYLFTRMPQVGVWLATTRATLENGCLFVAPGSHREPIHKVIPDRRPGSNYGYMEVVDYDFSKAVPVLMDPGDVLIFHSFLLHMSNDNTSSERRSALVNHYANSDTQVIGQKSPTIDFMRI